MWFRLSTSAGTLWSTTIPASKAAASNEVTRILTSIDGEADELDSASELLALDAALERLAGTEALKVSRTA